MNSDPVTSEKASVPPIDPTLAAGAQVAAAPAATVSSATLARRGWQITLALALAGALGSLLVWQKLSKIQAQLARQSADSGSQASEARATARQAQALAMETAAKLSVTEAKLAEVSLQRSQLEDLMQGLSRSRDENLVVDIDSSIRLAQQQTQLTGSIEPLLAALRTADARITRAAQPRLAQLQRAIARDVGRIKATALADTPTLLVRLDELVTMVDDLPIANAVGARSAQAGANNAAKQTDTAAHANQTKPSWWTDLLLAVREEVRGLVRVSQIDVPDAALLSPEQSFFVKENLKLRLLNARLGLQSRQIPAVRADLNVATTDLGRYFDASSRKTQSAAQLLQQIRSQTQSLEIPRIDDTLAALATAAAGR